MVIRTRTMDDPAHPCPTCGTPTEVEVSTYDHEEGSPDRSEVLSRHCLSCGEEVLTL